MLTPMKKTFSPTLYMFMRLCMFVHVCACLCMFVRWLPRRAGQFERLLRTFKAVTTERPHAIFVAAYHERDDLGAHPCAHERAHVSGGAREDGAVMLMRAGMLGMFGDEVVRHGLQLEVTRTSTHAGS